MTQHEISTWQTADGWRPSRPVNENELPIQVRVEFDPFNSDAYADLMTAITGAIEADYNAFKDAPCPDFVYKLIRIKKKC